MARTGRGRSRWAGRAVSFAVVTTPRGLVEQVVDETGLDADRDAVDLERSLSASTRRPRTATSPLTVTRPSAIRSSQTRRLPQPGARRAPSAAVHPGQLGTPGSQLLPERRLESRPSAAQSAARSGISARASNDGSHAEAHFERLDHVGAGDELGDRRQVVDRVEAQTFEERRASCRRARPGPGRCRGRSRRCSRVPATSGSHRRGRRRGWPPPAPGRSAACRR